MAHCLIWAGRDFDRLTPGHPREKDLELLADQLDAANVLPPYGPKPPPGRRPGRRGRKNARNKNKDSQNAGAGWQRHRLGERAHRTGVPSFALRATSALSGPPVLHQGHLRRNSRFR